MDYDNLLGLFKKRRSIRKYKDEIIPDEDIDKLIEAARWAPSGANKQEWEFIVIKKEETKKRIAEILEEQFRHMRDMEQTKIPELRIKFLVPSLKGSVFILPFGDKRTFEIVNVYARVTRTTEIFACDMANAFLYMVLAANAMGLGTRWSSVVTTPYAECLIKELLGLPEQFTIFDMLVVGYPDETPAPRFIRPKAELIHREYYDKSKFRTDEQVHKYLLNCLRGSPVSQQK